ncbi:MAG: HAMP domain-containing sensor histidine kinase [Polyangiaceae bacterium]
MRLTWKLTWAIALGIVVVLTIGAWVRVRADANAYRRDTLRDHYVMGRGLATAVELLWAREGAERALELVQLINAREQRIAIRWVWPDDKSGAGAPRSRGGLPRAGEVVHSSEVRGADGTPLVMTYVPVHLPGLRQGAIELSESASEEQELLRGAMLRSGAMTLVLIAICSALILIFGVVFVARPMRLLVRKANSIGAGDLELPLVVTQRDEIFDLAAAMNTMCERLKGAREEARQQVEAREIIVEQLRHADRLRTIGELSTGLAHELGSPLNVVRVRAAMIGSGEVSEQRMRELGALIVDQADRASAIIRQLLDFARRDEPRPRATDLRSVVSAALRLVSPLAETAKIELLIREPAGHVPAFVDPAQLQQALANIIVNAIHASTANSVVSITLRAAPAAEIEVHDSGTGISAANLSRIFDPFFTTKPAGIGTGLGLSVTAGILREHGARITVESEVGVGTRFLISFPNEHTPSQYPTSDFATLST